MSETREQLRLRINDWLRDVVEKTRIAPTRLATEIGISPSTLTRPLNEPDYRSVLSTDIIAKIVAYTGLPGPKGITLSPVPAPPAGFAEPELRRIEAPANESGLSAARAGQDVWENRGVAMEMEGIMPGDHLLVDMNLAPRSNDIVIAQVYNDARGDAETVLRRYDPPFLLAAQAVRRPPKPLLVDNDRVVIRGVVIERWGQLSRGAA